MSDVRIDSISLEVDASAAVSAAGIDKLAAALANLKNSAKLTSTANSLVKLNTALKGLQNTSATAQSLSSLTTALNQLSNVKNMDSFKKAVNTLNRVPKALNGISGSGVGSIAMQLQSLTGALTPIGDSGKNLRSVFTQLKKIPELTAQLEPQVIGEFAAKIQQLSTAIAPLAAQMSKVAAGFNTLPKNIQKALSTLDNYNNKTKRTVSANNLLEKSLVSLKTKWLVYGYAVKRVADLLTNAFTDFTERYETMNLFSVAMGEYTEEAYEYATKVQDALGINAAEWARDQAVFMQLIAGFGEARDQAYRMSKGLTEITYDIASLYNLPLEEAFTKVQSGISGELEPLRRLGFDLSQTRLQEIALANGINKKVSAMNQAEKSELRYIAITQQMPNVIGDMSRTLTSPANALRVLRSQFTLLSQTIGSLINVVVYKFIPYIQAMVSVIISAANAISVLLTGKSLKDWDKESFNMSSGLGGASEDSSDIADNLGDAADNAKKAKDYLMGWDELNVIDPTSTASSGGSGGSGVGGGGGLGLELDSLWTDSMLDNLLGQTDELTRKMKDIMEWAAVIGTALLAWKLGNKLLDDLKAVKEIISKIGDGSVTGLTGWLKVFATIGGVIASLAALKESLDKIVSGITLENVISQFADWTAAVTLLSIGLGSLKKGGIAGLILGLADMVATFINMKKELEELGKIGDETWLSWLADWAEISIAAGLTFGPEGAIIAALGYLLATLLEFAFPEQWQEFTSSFTRVWETVKVTVEQAVTVISAYFDLFKVALHQLITYIKTGSFDTSKEIKERVTTDLDVIENTHFGVTSDMMQENSNLYSSWMDWQDDMLYKSDTYYENQMAGYEHMKSSWDTMTKGQLGSFEDFCKNSENRNTVLGRELGKVYDSIGKDWDTTNTNMDTKFGVTVKDIGDQSLTIQTAIGTAGTNSETSWNTSMGNIDTKSSTVAGNIETNMAAIPGKVNGYSADFENTGKNMLDGVFKGFGAFSTISTKLKEWKDNFLKALKEKFGIASPSKVMRDEIGVFLGQGIGEGLVRSASYVKGSIDEFASSTLSAFGSDFDMSGSKDDDNTFLDYGGAMMEALANGMDNSSSTVFSTLRTIADTINSIMSDLVQATRVQSQSIISAAQAAREAASSIGVYESDSYSVRGYASGGSVPSGQLFMANESGPELVGSIGNTTTVMNNDQIVAAVSAGVAKAVAAVMGSNSNSGSQKIEVYLDGDKIYANQKKIARNKGYAFDKGAFTR